MRKVFLTASMLVFLAAGCAIQVPDVKVKPERSPEQRRAIGEPKVPSPGLAEVSWGELAEEAVLEVQRARQNQQRRRAELDTLEARGIVGETRTGEVVLLHEENLRSSLERRRVSRLVEAENRDRALIKEWLLQCLSTSAPVPPDSVEAALIRKYQQLAPRGSRLQRDDNQWEQKNR